MKEVILLSVLLALVAALMAPLGFRGREQVVGIDLGTTFSVVALKSGESVTVLPDKVSGMPLVPSVVGYLDDGTTLVGDAAVALRSRHPERVVFNAKRFIGRTLEEVAAADLAHPFKVAARPNENKSTSSTAGFFIPGDEAGVTRWVSPIDVGAEVVRHMKASIASYMGYDISRAVICVPAKFSLERIKATQEAFQQAGFKVDRIVEEPTAAAVAYNLHKGTGVRYILVYDIGGGTLDTSLLYMNDRAISVLGVAGDDHLGGSDFDLRMRDLLMGKLPTFKRGARREPPPHRCDRNGLLILAEQAKIDLSNVLTVEVRCADDDGSARTVTVTRAEFEEACADLFSRSMAPVRQVLEGQMMTPADLQDVVMVGGASRTPRLRRLLQDILGSSKRIHTEIDPDVTVAYGAANILD